MRDSPDSASKRSRSKSSNSSASRKSRSRSASSASRSRSRSRSIDDDRIDGYRLHIADIGDDVRRSDLEKVFTPFGELKEVWMTNSTPCFGFAVFKDKKAAAAALKGADGVEVSGSRIRVTYARPRTRGSGKRLYNSNTRCYQCGYTGHFYRDCPEISAGGDKRDREVGGSRIHVTYARPRSRGSGRRFYNNNMSCYQCGYTGHFYRDCPENSGGGDKRDRYGRSRGYRESRGGGDYDRERRRRSSRSGRYEDRPRRSGGSGRYRR